MRWGGLHGRCAGGGDLHGRCVECACPGGSSGVAESRPFRHGRAHPIWFRRPHRCPTLEPRRSRPFDLRRCPRRPDSVRPNHPEAYHAALPLLTRLPPSQMLCPPATVGREGGAAGHLCCAVGAESRRLAVGFIGWAWAALAHPQLCSRPFAWCSPPCLDGGGFRLFEPFAVQSVGRAGGAELAFVSGRGER